MNSLQFKLRSQARNHKQTNTSRISLPWVMTIGYLSLILLLPLAALIIKSLSIGTVEFWQYRYLRWQLLHHCLLMKLTFVTALAAGIINGIMGTLVAWILSSLSISWQKN